MAAKRPQVPEETVALIKRMAAENRWWGAERSRGDGLRQDLESVVVGSQRVGYPTPFREVR